MGTERTAAFVGRTQELAELTQARLDSHRRGGVCVIVGDAGLGKSHLLDEFLRSAPRGRTAIGVGRAIEHVRSPFEPWIAALRQVAPEAAAALRPVDGRFNGQGAMYRSVLDALRESAKRRSLLVALEDLQWADDGSLDLLHLLLAQSPPIQRLLVVATIRGSELDDRLRSILTHAEVSVLELTPLPMHDTLALVRDVIPSSESLRAEQIAELSGGNPFFAIELARSANRGGIPLTLRSAIDARLAQLPEQDIAMLEAAAVLGEAFDLAQLADLFEIDAADVARHLHDAERLRIVVGQPEGAFRFVHALTRAVLADRLTSAQRIDLHRRAAQALERRARFDALGFAELAYHYAGAQERAKAYAYRMRAGGLAYAIHAYADATRFFAQAAKSAEAGSLERARALARQGDALFRVPDLDQSELVYREAIDIYRNAGAHEDAARLYQSLATSLFNQNRMRDALEFLERAYTDLAPLPVDLSDELALQAAMQGLELDVRLGKQWLLRVDEERVRTTTRGGSYYALTATARATRGDGDGFLDALSAFEKNVESVVLDPHYVGYFGNLGANALFLGFPAMSLYERCFALARSLKLEVYEAAFASHAAFERWLHGDDESFGRLASFATARDAPIPALHAYVLLSSLLRGDALPPAREIESLIAAGHNEFYGPLTGVFARRAIESGNAKLGRRMLDLVAERLTEPYAAWEALTAMAEFGSDGAREKAEHLLQPYRDSTAPAFAATAAMVEALAASRDGDVATRDARASRAAELYARCGWIHHERRARAIGVTTPSRPVFSEREREVARLLQLGRSNRAMAAELFISEKTVEKHLARVYEKLKVSNRAAAVQALMHRAQE